MSQAASTLRYVIEESGHRRTSPRMSLINAITSRPEGFTAEELCARLPTVGRATVYRTLKLLTKLGLICKTALLDGAPRYAMAGSVHHHHVICIRCGTISEFQSRIVEGLLQTIREATTGAIVGHRIEIYVVCQNCYTLEKAAIPAQSAS